jgi:hypothetical protein
MDFKDSLKFVKMYVSSQVDITPYYNGRFDESFDIKEDLLEFNKRNVLTLNCKTFYDGPCFAHDGSGILPDGFTAVQTPYFEALCLLRIGFLS